MQLGNGSNALLTYHFFWNRIVHQLLYDDNISNGTISITSTTDSIIAGHYVYDNATITINDKSLEWFDEGTNTIHTKEGSYELVYGNSSDATKAIGIKVE